MRQAAIGAADPEVRGYAVTHPIGEVQLPTQDGWQQIIYAKSGLFVARSDRRTWTIPPHRALCVGDGSRIRLQTRKQTAVRCLYLRREIEAIGPTVRVVNVTALTRELLLHAVESSPLDLNEPIDSALLTLLIDRLSSQPSEALELPLPSDGRARRLAERLLANPELGLDRAMAPVGAGRRNLERMFRN
ncbi:MAG: hypothetical protein ACR2QK_06650, partial [Acidimicrobiales bacterium]